MDLKDSHARRPLPPMKSSHLSTIIENPLDHSSDNSNDPTNTSNNPSRIISPPPFYTKRKRPKRLSKMTRFKLFPNRKSSLYQFTNNVITAVNTSPSQDSILPWYSTVNSNPND